MNKRGKSKIRMGTVVSDKMQKTITVRVERSIQHAEYGKVIRRSTRFKVHDEKNEARTGDRVTIRETRPLSKDKRWKLVSVDKKN